MFASFWSCSSWLDLGNFSRSCVLAGFLLFFRGLSVLKNTCKHVYHHTEYDHHCYDCLYTDLVVQRIQAEGNDDQSAVETLRKEMDTLLPQVKDIALTIKRKAAAQEDQWVWLFRRTWGDCTWNLGEKDVNNVEHIPKDSKGEGL